MRRLVEDPQVPAGLRNRLLRSQAAGQDYEMAAKLAQLRSALSDPSRQPLGQPAKLASTVKQVAWRVAHPAWKLKLVLMLMAAVGGMTALAALYAEMPSNRLRQASIPVQAPMPKAEPSSPPTAAVVAQDSAVPASPQPAVPAVSEHQVAAQAQTVSTRPSQPRVQRREVAQIVRMRALLKRNPAAAYELGQQAQREFPRGVLIEEREALSIVALARTGSRDAAERRAHDFFISFPDSPLREFVEAGLKP